MTAKYHAVKITDLRKPCKRTGACKRAPCRTGPLPILRVVLVLAVLVEPPVGAVSATTFVSLN